MTFLSDEAILSSFEELISQDDIQFDKNGRPKQLQGSSYEMRLGKEVFLCGEKRLIRLGKERFDVAIKPGDFAILLTYEEVIIPPRLMGFITIRNKYKTMGLINISGFHVDPGFKGSLTFSVYNAGPGEIILRYKEPIFIIFFALLTTECKKPYPKEQDHIPGDAMNKLTGKPVSPSDLETRVQHLENTSRIQWTLLATATVGILLLVLKLIFSK
ncbi:MAG: hypothetical protein ABIL06_20250 [Pseudomonadota bacterium]